MNNQLKNNLTLGLMTLILLISVSCGVSPTSDIVTLDTWLDRVELDAPFTPQGQTALSARYLVISDPTDPVKEVLQAGASLNMSITIDTVDTTKTALSAQDVESEQIITMNEELPYPDYGFSIWLYKAKPVYDNSSFIVYFTYGFSEVQVAEETFWASLELDQELDGSFTTTIVSDQGDDNGLNYFSYNSSTGDLVSKMETVPNFPLDEIWAHSYEVFTCTNKVLGSGDFCRITDADDPTYMIIQYRPEGVYLYENETNDGGGGQSRFWDDTTAVNGEVITGTEPTMLTDLIATWVSGPTATTAKSIDIHQSMRLDTSGPELGDLF